MTIYAMDATIWVDVPRTSDPEEVARSMDRGLERAIEHFDKAEVIQADVKRIRQATPDEIAEEGFEET